MPLFIINNNITKLKVDAIVNVDNETILTCEDGDNCIYKVAVPDLLKENKTKNGCEVGEAKITKGYNLPVKYIIHTIAPIWKGGNKGEEELLKSCYKSSLQLAIEKKCKSIAFPVIATKVNGYPKSAAMKVAKQTIISFLSKIEGEIDVFIVLFGNNISEYLSITDKTIDELNSVLDIESSEEIELSNNLGKQTNSSPFSLVNGTAISRSRLKTLKSILVPMTVKPPSEFSIKLSYLKTKLKELLFKTDEGFSAMVMRKIKENNLDEVECYKAAGVNKQIFYKIRKSASNLDGIPYQPSKNIVLAFAIALKLNVEGTKELLDKAGYSLSKSNKTDIIVEYCISNGIDDILMINEILFYFSLPLLGSKCSE